MRYLSLWLAPWIAAWIPGWIAAWIPATAQVAPMLNLVVLEGDGATSNIRQRTAREPIVQVQDENHKPVAGVARGFRPNGLKGQFQIRVNASHQGRTASASINQTNAVLAASGAATAGAGLSGKLIAGLAVAGAAAVGGAYYATHSGSGTTLAAIASSNTTIAAGAGSVGPPR